MECCEAESTNLQYTVIYIGVAEPHYFYAAPAPGKNFDAAPTLLYSKPTF
jgi:hypothetical protein